MYNYEIIFQEGLQIAYKKGYEGNLAIAYAEGYRRGYEKGYKIGLELAGKEIESQLSAREMAVEGINKL